MEPQSYGGQDEAGSAAATPAVSRLFLVRHGRTALNAAGVLRGRLDPALDPVGRHEAEQVAAALAGRGIRQVMASPLQRAVETATAIAATIALTVETDARLADRDYGRWAGQTLEDVEAAYGSVDLAPEIEPREEVLARSIAALTDLAHRSTGASAVAVSHDVVLRFVLTTLDPRLGKPEDLPQHTGCFNVIDFLGDSWRVVSVNQVPDGPETEP